MTRTKKKVRHGLKHEAIAVFGVFFGLFFLLSLVSGFFSSGRENWCGPGGQFLFDKLFFLFGFGAFFLAALMLVLSLFFFAPGSSYKRLPYLLCGLLGIVVSISSLIASFWLISERVAMVTQGGYIGSNVFNLLSSQLGSLGATLCLLLFLLISIMLAVQFSPYQFFIHMIGAVSGLFTKFKSWLSSKKKSIIKTEKKKIATADIAADSLLVDHGAPVVKELPVSVSFADDDDRLSVLPLAKGNWQLPPFSILRRPAKLNHKLDKEIYFKVSRQLEQKLKNFGVSGKVVGISPGPVVTTYEYAPAPGVKISKIVALSDDLALGLKSKSVRVVGSVPGKAALGIEIPNPDRQIVFMGELLRTDVYSKDKSKLALILGYDVVGNPVITDLSKMPHLLIAGSTGSGKSVAVNAMIASILFKSTPEDVRFLMIDPKRIELSGYEGIPHLLHPVVIEPKMASRALQWAVREMERRYLVLEKSKVKSFDSYNQTAEEKMPYIVIVVDELADLMMVASKEVETAIARLAQMARAAGMHLILSTQRPSVDVLTGLIKANFPTRISFKVASKVDSRTILDGSGAEHLLGAGDMLFLPPGSGVLRRVHGALITESETAKLVDFLKNQGDAEYDKLVLEQVEDAKEGFAVDDQDVDELYDEAVSVVCELKQASISMLQRRLRVGYNRAARMIEIMENEGIVGPADGAKPREVLVRGSYDQ